MPSGSIVYLDGGYNKNVLGVSGSYFRLKLSAGSARRRRGDGIIILTAAKSVVATVQANFSLETRSYNFDGLSGGFSYATLDNLLQITNAVPLSGCLIVDTSVSGAPYGIPMEPMDIDDYLITTFHQDRIPITGGY